MILKKFPYFFLFVLLICSPACIQSTDDMAQTEAKDESVLNIYTSLEDDQLKDYLAGFQKAYPDVKLNITRDSTGIITAKLLAEKENVKADLVWGLAASSLLLLKSEGMLAPYAPKGVERILPLFKDELSPPQWVGIDVWEAAFLVNKDVLERNGITEIPQTYKDLIDPQYKGLIAMPHPASSGTGLLFVNAFIALYGEEEAWAFFDKLHENVAVYHHSGSAPAKTAAQGEYGIGLSYGYRCIKSAMSLGDLGAVVFPSEGSGWDMEANALLKRPEGEKEIAKKFLDWAINDEQMFLYGKNYPIVATGLKTNVPSEYKEDPVDQLIENINLQWCADNRDRILAEWSRRYDGQSN